MSSGALDHQLFGFLLQMSFEFEPPGLVLEIPLDLLSQAVQVLRQLALDMLNKSLEIVVLYHAFQLLGEEGVDPLGQRIVRLLSSNLNIMIFVLDYFNHCWQLRFPLNLSYCRPRLHDWLLFPKAS